MIELTTRTQKHGQTIPDLLPINGLNLATSVNQVPFESFFYFHRRDISQEFQLILHLQFHVSSKNGIKDPTE